MVHIYLITWLNFWTKIDHGRPVNDCLSAATCHTTIITNHLPSIYHYITNYLPSPHGITSSSSYTYSHNIIILSRVPVLHFHLGFPVPLPPQLAHILHGSDLTVIMITNVCEIRITNVYYLWNSENKIPWGVKNSLGLFILLSLELDKKSCIGSLALLISWFEAV